MRCPLPEIYRNNKVFIRVTRLDNSLIQIYASKLSNCRAHLFCGHKSLPTLRRHALSATLLVGSLVGRQLGRYFALAHAVTVASAPITTGWSSALGCTSAITLFLSFSLFRPFSISITRSSKLCVSIERLTDWLA